MLEQKTGFQRITECGLQSGLLQRTNLLNLHLHNAFRTNKCFIIKTKCILKILIKNELKTNDLFV